MAADSLGELVQPLCFSLILARESLSSSCVAADVAAVTRACLPSLPVSCKRERLREFYDVMQGPCVGERGTSSVFLSLVPSLSHRLSHLDPDDSRRDGSRCSSGSDGSSTMGGETTLFMIHVNASNCLSLSLLLLLQRQREASTQTRVRSQQSTRCGGVSEADPLDW